MSVTAENQNFNPLLHQPPKYDIFGRIKKVSFVPGANKNNILGEKESIKIPWLDKRGGDETIPKTRTQMIDLRKKEKIPDISYDLDMDGFVGGKDYLLSKRFDLDRDGKLDEKEKKQAYEAIHNNYEDKFLWNIESRGPNNKLRVLQKRGKILQGDDFMPIRETYPPHPLSSKIPKHESLQKLKESRKMSTKLEVEEKMRKWEEANPTILVSEPLNINMEYKPEYYSVKEKKEEAHRLARIECGLEEEEEDIDKRKNKELSLNYIKNPKFKTRADLKKEYRREIMEKLNKSNNPNHKDETQRLKEREDEIFAILYKNSKDRKSLTKLKEKRKNERIDYNMKTFSKQTIGVHGHELPKFSENEEMKEYWKFRDGYVENPPINSHVLYKEHVKYWKKPEDLLINEHQDEVISPQNNKEKMLKEKKDNLIIKVNNLNHFKDYGFDPDNPQPIDIEQIPKNHIYKWSTLVNQFAPQKFRKGRFFDSLPDANDDKNQDMDSSIYSQKDIFQSEHMKKIVNKKTENLIKTSEIDKTAKDGFTQESLFHKLSLNNKDQGNKNEQPVKYDLIN